MHVLSDISLARDALGWTPKVSLEDGLESTIAYFRELFGLAGTTTSVPQLAPAVSTGTEVAGALTE
jgi:hypothetical protein